MAKKVSWMWGGKRYSGTLIRETKTHKFISSMRSSSNDNNLFRI